MRNKKIRGRNKFQESWLSKDEYKSWLHKSSDYAARCKLCKKDINVDNVPIELFQKNIVHPGLWRSI